MKRLLGSMARLLKGADEAGTAHEASGVDVLFDLTRDQLASQLNVIDGLDMKAGLVLASASLLTSVLASWRIPAAVFGVQGLVIWIAQHIVVAGMLSFAFVTTTSITALLVRNFEYPTSPEQLWMLYRSWSQSDIKQKMRSNMAAAHARNDKRIRVKVFWTKAAYYALGFEAATVFVVLWLQQVLH